MEHHTIVAMLIAQYHPCPEGGAESQCRRLSTLLVKRGIQVRVVTIRNRFGVPRRQTLDGVEVIRLGILSPLVRMLRDRRQRTRGSDPAASPSGEQGGLKWSRFAPSLVLLRLEKLCFMVETALHLSRCRRALALLHCHESHWLAGFSSWLAFRLRLPVFIKEANYPVLLPIGSDTPWPRRWEAWRLRARYLAQTTAAAEGLQRAGVAPQRITLVPNGVEVPAEVADVASNRQVLHVGHLYANHKKAFDVLLPAWARVLSRIPDARLVIVGAGDPQPWITLLDTLKATSSVTFAGHVPEVAPEYRRSALFVLPSRREGLSNALLESQSWGLPAVVSDIPGNTAVVRHGVNGVVVPVDDSEALAAAMIDLLTDPARRVAMGARARETAVAQFSLGGFCDRVLDNYRQVLGGDSLPDGEGSDG